jgi:hypothetical protein
MNKYLAILLLGLSSLVTAQTIETSPNLITNPTFVGTTGWSTTGGVGGAAGGPAPANGTGYTFTYTAGSIAQTYAINQALSSVGAGVQISGFDYGFKYRFGCANQIGGYCENPAGVQDTLNATSTITSNTGATLYTRTYMLGRDATAPYSATFTSVDTQQRFGTATPIESLGDFKILFNGMDNGYWAGNYGPTIKDVYSKAVYTVDPCVANPMSSPSCAGYSNIVTSPNIAAQSYAINQALALSGSGVQINGFQYGYDYYVGGEWCSAAFLIFCTAWSPSSMDINVNVTSNTGSSLYSATHSHGSNTSGSPSYSYMFPTQRPLSTMGNFELSANGVGTTALYSSWSRWQYTPDPCVANPLSSTTCEGYAAAYFTQQCTANPLYNSACPGYAEALFAQQCSANALTSPACPGYASAYLTYQCSINPLYSTTCAGYEEAYLNSECIKDSLFSTKCEGYATAYAIKYLVPLDSSTSSAVNSSLSDTAAVKANDPTNTKVAVNTVTTTVSTDGTVSTGVSVTGDTNVDKTISTKTTTTSNDTAPAAPVKLSAPPPPTTKTAQVEPKKDGPSGNKEERKDEGKQTVNGPGGGGNESKPNDQPRTNREALAEKRRDEVQKEAIAKGKDLANEMGKAADMETQKAVQNVVIQAMGFTPGFDTYNKTMIPDTTFYKPFTVYGNQKNIDTPNSRRLLGGSDRTHEQMVDSQFQLGK